MASPLREKITLSALRQARAGGTKVAMLTCYDFTMARLMQEAGVPSLLAGDSAASVILGHPTTLPAPLDFMIEITAAVRRGAPLAFLVADMPFGSYQESTAQGVRNVVCMVKRTACDCVKLEVAESQVDLVQRLADAGVAVMAHMGLRPQTVGLLGGYKAQGRTAADAERILALALQMEAAGAAALLLEAVPPEVAKAVVEQSTLPVIGCGAGPACHGSVIVTHDGLGWTGTRPKFVPDLGDAAEPLKQAFGKWVRDVSSGAYPAPEQTYAMPAAEARKLADDRSKSI